MKQLAVILATIGAFAIATPVVMACPGHDKAKSEEADAPRTADKDKQAPAKKGDKKKDQKKETSKDGDKVSRK
jgi:hypothetical protein